MATSPGVFKNTQKRMSNFPVLPPIEGAQQLGEIEQIIAKKEEIAEKVAVSKKLLRHKRSKMEVKQRLKILYVLSSAMIYLIFFFCVKVVHMSDICRYLYWFLFPEVWQFVA